MTPESTQMGFLEKLGSKQLRNSMTSRSTNSSETAGRKETTVREEVIG
jgi:hypothetical protein